MIKIIDGDLLASKTDIIAHQVNCKGAFNSGVARAIREYDVQVFHDYRAYCSSYLMLLQIRLYLHLEEAKEIIWCSHTA